MRPHAGADFSFLVGFVPFLLTMCLVLMYSFQKEGYNVKELKNFIRPSHVFLNFFNYFRRKDLDTIREICKIRKPDFVGTGKYTTDVVPWSDRFMEEL